MQNYDSFTTRTIARKVRRAMVFAALWGAAAAACAQIGPDHSGPVIVIDPGHGGRDPGAGNAQCFEKEVCLEVARLLRDQLNSRMPEVRVVLTRESDVFVPLKQRAAQANEIGADWFISLHCNAQAGHPRAVRGSESYVMGLHKTKENLEVARRENLSLLYEEGQEAGSDDALERILLHHLQDRNLQRSIECANAIERAFSTNHPGGSRGPRQAGFVVLHQAAMPAVLVEMGYLTHPDDAALLCSTEGRRNVATSIAEGLGALLANAPVKACASQTEGSDGAMYCIQLAATRNDPGADPRWRGVEGLQIAREDQLYRVFVGSYTDPGQARRDAFMWVKRGFSDAFVVPIPGTD
ncbi:MAG: N-acetylmuramoyl-L-alanine amidase [Saprospiraceae bacterium]|nr:N-acetylmuramoyl-L-alanine amidase [Saprospiraceae bacterium]